MHKYIKLITAFVVFQYSFSQNDKNINIKIIDKPITYQAKRIKLSLDYLKERHGLNQDKPTIIPKMIVLHFTGSGNLESNFNYFNNEEIENARTLNKKQSSLNVSAHFLIDRDGSIYRLMDENLFARHTIGLNYCAIGVENIGSDKQPLTKEQEIANINLVKYLYKKHKIEYLIGHSEYLSFQNSKLWKETNPKYITHKIDPGAHFMKQIRAALKDYPLKSKP